MPIFEYQCGHCHSEFETLVMSAAQAITCPECASSRVKKLFSSFAVKRSSAGSSSSAGCQTCSGKHCATCH